MTTKRRKFSPAFKVRVVLELLTGEKGLLEASRQLNRKPKAGGHFSPLCGQQKVAFNLTLNDILISDLDCRCSITISSSTRVSSTRVENRF